MKIWTEDGRLAYSDEPRLIGSSYTLDEGKQAAFREGEGEAEVIEIATRRGGS